VGEDTAQLGRRERRKLEARERLLAAARQLIAGQGAAELRIADLTTAADLGFGTFYNHFESKEAIIEAVLEDVLSSAATAIGSRALEFDDPAETASYSYRRFIRFAQDEPELAAVLAELAGADDLFERSLMPYARKTLERGRDSGRFRLDDLELALISISAAAFAAIKGVLSGRLHADAGTIGAEMMLRGFGVEFSDSARIANRPLEESDTDGWA
jgi:AcrR family transcriptional regulator